MAEILIKTYVYVLLLLVFLGLILEKDTPRFC